MAHQDKMSVTLPVDLVNFTVGEVERLLPDFLRGNVGTSAAVQAAVRRGLQAMVEERGGDVGEIPESVDHRRTR